MSISRENERWSSDRPAKGAEVPAVGFSRLVQEGLPVEDHEIAAAQRRVRHEIDLTLRATTVRFQREWWRRSLTVPMPVVAAVMLLFLFFSVIAVRFSGAFSPRMTRVPAVADGTESLHINVNVGEAHAGELLRWLNEQQRVETITIELPSQAQFQLRGEPVVLRGVHGELVEPELIPIPEGRVE